MKSFAHTMLSAEAQEALKRLGQHIRLARIRRKESQSLAAERSGFSKLTQQRLEAGHPGISIGILARALESYGFLDQLNVLADPNQDAVGIALERAKLFKRSSSQEDTEEFNSDF